MPQPTLVTIWLIPIEPIPAPHHGANEILSREEQDRANRLVSEELAHRFRNAHIAKRIILASCTGEEPQDLRFDLQPKGKPYLKGLANPPFFNLSHSADLAALAVCETTEVGVDIEHERPVEQGLARRFFSAAEADALDAISLDQRRDAFLRCWTRKEAYLKATGMGLYDALNSFEVVIGDPAEKPQAGSPKNLLASINGQTSLATSWALADMKMPPKYFGAVAARCPRDTLSITINHFAGPRVP